MRKHVSVGLWVGLVFVLVSRVGWANDKNFKAAAGQSGCKSLITRDGVEACQKVQSAKNAACNRPSDCELSKQEDWVKEYDELYRWWESEGSKLPDSSYRYEKTNHDRPSLEADNRLTKCERTVNVEWKSLPF